ncbi:hypothetical protein MHY87_15505 [Microvirga sp. ACRRW]|uniref:hypothetical protein n=1 Tax=Microvirga sp. ACRRW TaxID=2918205 RepID=UPI001EF3DDBC|nr:hypothetical protein [Microvirga sp. ACRRW]MCG7394310.1 hypothetical protein [Microvirga sp. ACRRW]
MSYHSGSKNRRKDTAAYASPSFFTCQRANLVPKRQEREPAPPPLARRAVRASSPTTRQRPPSMELYLIEPDFQVNTHFRVFLIFLSAYLRRKAIDKAFPFPEDVFLLGYTYRKGGPFDEYWDFSQRSLLMPQISPWSWAHVFCQGLKTYPWSRSELACSCIAA